MDLAINPTDKWSNVPSRGQSILYLEMAGVRGSFFDGFVGPELEKRLNNGRFWEELPGMRFSLNIGAAYYVVDDVLANYYRDLDLEFVDQGFEMFVRNGGGKVDYDLRGLSAEAIEAYFAFLQRIYGRLETYDFQRKDFGILIRPYIDLLTDLHRDGYGAGVRDEKVFKWDLKKLSAHPLVIDFS